MIDDKNELVAPMPDGGWPDGETLAVIRKNNRIIAQYTQQYGKVPGTAPLQRPGSVISWQPIQQGLMLKCEQAQIELKWLNAEILRVRLLDQSPEQTFSYAISKQDWNEIPVRISENHAEISVHTASHTAIIDKQTARIQIQDNEGAVISADSEGMAWQTDAKVQLSLTLQKDEACYGTGERAFSLNLRGRSVTLWNTDAGAYLRGYEPINYSIPFYLGVHNHGSYGILWDNSNAGQIHMGSEDADMLRFECVKGQLTYYVFTGPTVNDVVSQYTLLTGRMPMPPMWAMGYHQCRYSYMDEQDVLDTVRELRARSIPCDAIYLDIHYMDQYRVFTWDKERFPDLKRMVSQLDEMGVKTVVIIDPGVMVDDTYSGYLSGLENDVFMKYPDGAVAAGVVWPGLCHFPDFSNPGTREWWAEQLMRLLSNGIAGIWNDMNEPLYFGDNEINSPPGFIRHDKDGHTADHDEIHNVYGMQMARASRIALDRARPGKRQLNITRAGYAGAQRYASSWTGDNRSTWDHLKLSISITLNMGLSGQSFTGPDIGGFADDTTGELLVRWTQLGAFLPFFRNHSAVDTIRQEPWLFGEEVERACRQAISLRYQFMPYLYSVFADCHFSGYPVIRPLFSAEPENPHLRSIDDCYLLGDNLLVAPILYESELRREVYLPAGDWYDFHTNQRYAGAALISVEAPLDRLPLFVKSGTVLPMWPVMQHLSQSKPVRVMLNIYADSGTTDIYEDEGEGLGYQNDEFRRIRFECDETAHTLTLTRAVTGGFNVEDKPCEVRVIGATHRIRTVQVDGQDHADWHTENGIVTIMMNSEFKTLHITTAL